METRKANLTIEDFEDKKFGEGARAGRYTRFKTSEGWISSFDKPTIEKLKDSEGKNVCVEIATDKNDKEKITKFIGMAEENSDNGALNVEIEKIGAVNQTQTRKSVKGTAYEKDPVGLTTEVFCKLMDGVQFIEDKSTKAGLEMIMDTAIELVKKAQKEFE
jgi:hypothetical protein